jgi:hypothetical protein
VIAVIVAASLLIGVSLGILGRGGSILTVPILVYLAGLEAKQAIATSLFVVGVTSAAGVVSHARAGRVRWRTGLLFGLAGMTGAYGGGRLAEFTPGNILLIAFGAMMVVTAVAMIRGRKQAPKKVHHELPVAHVLLDGIVVGLVTGLVGRRRLPRRPRPGPAGRTSDGCRRRHLAPGDLHEVLRGPGRSPLQRAHRLGARRDSHRRSRRRKPRRRPPRRTHPTGSPAQGLRLVRDRHGCLRPRPADQSRCA